MARKSERRGARIEVETGTSEYGRREPRLVFRWASEREYPWQLQTAEVLRVAAEVYEEAERRGEVALLRLPDGIGNDGHYEDGWRSSATIRAELDENSEEQEVLAIFRAVAARQNKLARGLRPIRTAKGERWVSIPEDES